MCPNPFYQIYEGAAILAGAAPCYLNSLPSRNYAFDWEQLAANDVAAHAAHLRLLAGESRPGT